MQWTTSIDAYLSRRRAVAAERLIPTEARSGRILDVGCGGHAYFLRQTRFREKYGVDHEEWEDWSQLDRADFDLRVFDLDHGEPLPFEDGMFDVVTMLAVLEHVEVDRVPGFLDEVRRVLKSAGRLVLTTPPPRTDRLLPLLANLKLISHDSVDEHQHAYTREHVEGLLRDAGFREVQTGLFELGMNIWAVGVAPPS